MYSFSFAQWGIKSEQELKAQSEAVKRGWESRFSLYCSFLPLFHLPSQECPSTLLFSLSSSKLCLCGHKEALSGIPNKHFTSSSWMGKQVSTIYHLLCRKRARLALLMNSRQQQTIHHHKTYLRIIVQCPTTHCCLKPTKKSWFTSTNVCVRYSSFLLSGSSMEEPQWQITQLKGNSVSIYVQCPAVKQFSEGPKSTPFPLQVALFNHEKCLQMVLFW